MGSRYYEFSLFIESNWIRKINLDQKSKERGKRGTSDKRNIDDIEQKKD